MPLELDPDRVKLERHVPGLRFLSNEALGRLENHDDGHGPANKEGRGSRG